MITSIEIKGLRGIREGKLDGLTPLTVLVGPNGSGKSTVLDALMIGANPAPGEAIGLTVRRRHEIKYGGRWLLWRGRDDSQAEITINARAFPRRCRINLTQPVNEEEQILECRVYAILQTAQGERESEHGLSGTQFTNGGEFRTGGFTYRNQTYVPFYELMDDIKSVEMVNTSFPDPGRPLYYLLTQAIQAGLKQIVLDLMRAVVPGLSDLMVLTEGDRPIVHLVFDTHSVPVAVAGDGVHGLVRLALELASISEGVSLLEEPELHEHPGALRQVARVVLQSVRRKNQVVLTTHSLELIDCLLAEANDDAELEALSVFGVRLEEGMLKSYRIPGLDVAFSRSEIGDDLR